MVCDLLSKDINGILVTVYSRAFFEFRDLDEVSRRSVDSIKGVPRPTCEMSGQNQRSTRRYKSPESGVKRKLADIQLSEATKSK